MANLGTMLVRLGTDNRALVRGFQDSIRQIEHFADAAERVGTSMTLGVTAPALLMGGAALRATGSLESLEKGLTAMTGSASEAERQLARLTEIAKLPGISFQEAAQGSITLQAIGFSAAGAERSVRALGQAVAASPGGGAVQFEGVLRQFRQIAAQGRIMGDELNIMLENAPALAKAFQNAFGTTNAEAIRKLNLSTEEFFNRLLAGMEALPKVEGGLSNALENLGQASKRALGTLLLDDALALTKTIDGLSGSLEHAANVFVAIDPTTKRVALGLVAMAAAAGPLSAGVGLIARGFITARGAMTAIPLLAGRMSSGFRTLNNTLIATQAGLSFNAAAGRFQAASGVFVSRTAAITAAAAGSSRSMAVLRLAAGGLAGAIFSPGGLVIALGVAAAAFVTMKLRAAEAKAQLDEFHTHLEGLSETGLTLARAELSQELMAVGDEMERTQKKLTKWVNPMDGVSPAFKVEFDNPAYLALEQKAGEIRAQLETVAGAVDRLRESTSTDLGDFGGNTGPTETALDRLEKRVKSLLSTYENLRGRGDGTVGVLNDLMGVEREIEALIRSQGGKRTEDLERALVLASNFRDTLFGDLDQQIATPVMRDLMGKVITPKLIINGFEADPAALEEAKKRIQDKLRLTALLDLELKPVKAQAPKPIDDIEDPALEAFNDTLEAVRNITSSFGDLADALADVSPALAGSLQGVETFLNGLGRFKAGQSKGGVLGALGQVSGGIGMVAGIASVFAALNAGNQELVQAMDENEKALRDLRLTLSGFRTTFDAQRSALGFIDQTQDRNPLGQTNLFMKVTEDTTRRLAAFGLTIDQLVALGESFGIDVLDSKGRIIVSSLDALEEAIRRTRLSVEQFASTLDGQRTLLGARREIFDVTSPVAAAQDQLKLLNMIAPNLFGDLANLDLSSGAARAVLEKRLQELITGLLEGTITPEMIGGFESVQEFIDSLLSADKALDAFSDTLASLSNVPEIFDLVLRRQQAAATGGYTTPDSRAPAGYTPPPSGGRERPSLEIHIHNPPANMDVKEAVRQTKEALKRDPEFDVMVRERAS